ncbi:serine-rich adhesin for platelets-like isoform X1 [Mytilus edulis]|uniref:serine-rich adhesin for platelets-like isoform X1 n=1 Tax=Mytilus edulis TaxID=6550 RepID=UPI0039F14162
MVMESPQDTVEIGDYGDTDWMETGMESDVSDHLDHEEMYLMLQADMLAIKRQENALQTDIDDINQKFNSLIADVGLEPTEYPVNRHLLGNPPTPSFLQRNTPTRSHITCLDTTSCDEDVLLQKMLQGPLVSINSLSSDSIYDDSAMTLIIDNNSNYIPSPKPVSPSNLVPNIDRPEPSSSDISNASNGSSGYPRSTGSDSSDDNQCVPDIDDRQEELLSRLHYYGDFTIDRQSKIDNLTARLTNTPVANLNNMTASATEEIFTREVVGCEQEYVPPGFGPPSRSTTRSTSSNSSTSSPRRHRTKRISRAQRNRTSSSSGSRRSISIPQASSTMIEDFSPSSHSSGSSKHRSSSIPRASSTMIEDPTSSSCRPNSVYSDDMESVYCWSIKESSDDVPLEESYYRNINRLSSKPPLAPKKVLPSSCGTSLAESNCNNESMSMIASTTRRQDVVSDSLYDDVTFYNKARTLPRTSTRTDLNGNTKSSGSSIEARRASMPDMVSVMLSENDNVQSVPNSSASTHSSSLGDRPAIPGKSSSSGSNSNTSPPTSNDTRNTQAMCDSLLTDSPNSLSSTGVFAPNNSPYSSRASPVSEPEPLGPPAPPSSYKSKSSKEDQVFKKPKSIVPIWKLFRFRRNKPKSAENITSTPLRRPSSTHSDPVSKKKLFTIQSPEVHLHNKRAVAKKLRRFSESFRQKDTSEIHTLATL